jgi:DNA polymerase-3 subunit beta
MHIATTREAILAPLTLGSKVTDTRRYGIPILGCVMLSADAGWMDMTTTDMEVAVKSSIKTLIVEPGACVLPIMPLIAFVKALPKGAAVSIKLAEDGLHADLESGYRTATMTTMPLVDYPGVMPPKTEVEFKIDAAELHRILRQVRPAISTEETRYYLNGICLFAEKGDGEERLRAVATDGHRLMMADTALPDGLKVGALGKDGTIVPLVAVGLILEMLGKKPTGLVTFRHCGTRIGVRYGSQLLMSNLIDGTFPEYQRVIPRHNSNVMTTNAADCASIVTGIANAVSKEHSRPVKFSLGTEVMVSARNADSGAFSQSKLNGITSYAGDDMEIGFQARYVRDLLAVVDGTVHFACGDASAPAVITSDAEPRWLAVLMPMRV